MPKIKLTGQVMDDIYQNAIDLIPNGGRFIAATYLSNPAKRYTPKQVFEKTMAQMRHMVSGDRQEYIRAATSEYLQKHYSFPASDADSYECKIGRDSIILRYINDKDIALVGWLNRMNLSNKTLSDTGDMREYKNLTTEELMNRLDEHNRWVSDRQKIISGARDAFKMDDKALSEFMKSLPAARADFSGCTVRNIDFTRQNMDGVSFKNAKLEDCTFGQAQGADFSGAVFERCRFENGELSHASFRGSRQNDVRFENCIMHEADFTDGRMRQVTFSGCDLRGTVFSGIDLKELQFEQVSQSEQELSEPLEFQYQEQQSQPIDIQYEEPVQSQTMSY